MNLISCDECGVVLDENQLSFPEDIYDERYGVDGNLASWNGEEYVPFTSCPVCQNKILKGGYT